MALSSFEAREWERILLEGFGLCLEVVPTQGGRVVRLEARGHEWLWSNPSLQPPRRVNEPGSYVEAHDDGGWDEIFPNLSSRLAEGIHTWPDHGELWGRAWDVVRSDRENLTLAVVSNLLPVRFERSIRLEAPGKVAMAYRLDNLSDEKLAFTWAAHPVLAVSPGARWHVEVPLAWWPEADGAVLPRDLLDGMMPGREATLACKAFAPAPADGLLTVVDGSHALRFRWDPARIPHVGLWMNAGGWSGVPGAPPYHNLAVEPCIGPSDDFGRACALATTATMLAPREIRSWWLDLEFPTASEVCA
jgi:galactose mutarotase-like enzyme